MQQQRHLEGQTEHQQGVLPPEQVTHIHSSGATDTSTWGSQGSKPSDLPITGRPALPP